MIKHAPLNLYKPLKRSKELANGLPTHQGTGRGPRERSESDFRFSVRWFRPKFGPPKIEITIFYLVFGLFGSCRITKKNLGKK